MPSAPVPPSDELPFDAATLRFYVREAPVYAASGPGGASRFLKPFLNRLPPQARILELGCGGGRDAAAMLAAGFCVDITEGVPEVAREAETRLGRPVRVMRFDELDALAAYDAVWAHACLLHVPLARLPTVLHKIFRALKPGGLHFANYKAGGVAGRDRYGRYFNFPSGEQLLAAYRQGGAWRIIATEAYVDGGYDGRQGPWIAVTAERP
ncbi:MAG TPA: class I SAM-dependent methyltransferase [Stellaceae bacterium]|nr:class I SAM-dependent methyltransferase [Stellaceae bacterium]